LVKIACRGITRTLLIIGNHVIALV